MQTATMQTEQALTFFNLMSDPVIRRMCREDPAAVLEEIRSRGFEMPELDEGQEIKLVFNTADTSYVPLPTIDENSDLFLNPQQLSQMQAAGGGDSTASTLASSSSASTLSCPVGTASTGGSVGTIGTAGR